MTLIYSTIKPCLLSVCVAFSLSFSGVTFKGYDWSPSVMTFSSHVFSEGREQGDKDEEHEEDYWYSNRQNERKRGCRKDRERGEWGVERRREKEMLWDLFFSLAPGTYIKMLILVFFVSFYNSLHFVPLSALFLRLSLLFLHFILALRFLCTVMGSHPD